MTDEELLKLYNKENNITEEQRQAWEEEYQQRQQEYKTTEELLGSHALAKAVYDNPWSYALKLRTGETIEFTGCVVLNKDWIRIEKKTDQDIGFFPFPAERGIDIRISEIVWVVDAPHGS